MAALLGAQQHAPPRLGLQGSGPPACLPQPAACPGL